MTPQTAAALRALLQNMRAATSGRTGNRADVNYLTVDEWSDELAAVLTQEGAGKGYGLLRYSEEARKTIAQELSECATCVDRETAFLCAELQAMLTSDAPAEPRAAEGAGTTYAPVGNGDSDCAECGESYSAHQDSAWMECPTTSTVAPAVVTDDYCAAFITALVYETGTVNVGVADEPDLMHVPQIEDVRTAFNSINTKPTAAAAVPAGGDAVAWVMFDKGSNLPASGSEPYAVEPSPHMQDHARICGREWRPVFSAPRGGVTEAWTTENLLRVALGAVVISDSHEQAIRLAEEALRKHPPAAQAQDAGPMARHWREAIEEAGFEQLAGATVNWIEQRARALAAKEAK
jgi:hypothetical protein